MTALDAAALVALLAWPLHWMVKREFDRLEDPAYLARQGVVIVKLSAISSHAEPIGTYKGRERVGPGELYLEPGLVYVAV